VAIGVVSVVLAVVCLWAVVRTVTPGPAPKPHLTWQCSKCGERFESDLGAAAKAVFSESPTPPQHPCPKCQGAAYPVRKFRCTKCGHEFEQFLGPDPQTGKFPPLRCPKCRDPRVAPIQALEKT